ncbi:MAG: ImmA/IrrE family metallo-endopeptidase, partial [Dehalococcoidia bacterium]
MTAAAVPPVDAGRIGRLAHQFWSDAGGPPDFPRDPEPQIARAVHRYQMHVIDLPKLTCVTVAAWAQRNHFPPIDAATDRPLRGCLFTYAGSAFLLVDPRDPPAQRRVTIAHELGHFLIEISEPRRRVGHALGADALA